MQPHHQHLPTGACKDLSEALRTGAARGVGPEGMRNLRKEWDERCRDDDAQAMQIYHERQRLEREKKDQARRALASASGATPGREEQQAEVERCTELRRILDKRHERLDLTPGEKADLKNFEQSYQSRCGKSD